jgi:hypothetical protein
MRYKVHPKEKYIEKECMEWVDLSNWMLKIDFSCFKFIIVFTSMKISLYVGAL